MRFHVVGARRKPAAVAHVHVSGAGLARGQDGAAVLAGNSDHLGPRVGALQHVPHSLHLQVLRAGAGPLLGPVVDVGVRVIAGAVDRRCRGPVEPFVGDDAGAVRVGAGEQGGVPCGRHGESVPVMRLGEPRAAVEEPGKAVLRQLVAVVHDLPLREAVDGEEHHQLRLRRRGRIGGGTAGEQRCGGEQGGEESDHGVSPFARLRLAAHRCAASRRLAGVPAR